VAGLRHSHGCPGFAKWSAIGALTLGMLGQVAYHLLSAAHATRAPWPAVVLVSSLPVVVLGFGAALSHLLRSEEGVSASAPEVNPEAAPEPLPAPVPESAPQECTEDCPQNCPRSGAFAPTCTSARTSEGHQDGASGVYGGARSRCGLAERLTYRAR
jgi:hypothetical protein